MRTRLPLVMVAMLVVIACGAPDVAAPTTTAGPAGLAGSIHRSGGIAGLDETWTLEADGTVFGPDGSTGRMSSTALADLAAAAAASGFFELDAEYLPADQCCDRFTYRVTLTDGTRTHTVTTIDAAEAPAGLFALIQTFLAGVQAAA